MHRPIRFAVPFLLCTALSCARPGATERPAAPAPSPSEAPGAGPRPMRQQLTPEQRAARRDSLAVVRAGTVKQILQKIAGHENEPATEVFRNVRVLKSATAAQLVRIMDQGFGRSLGVGCTFCHVADKWDEDAKNAKQTARIMIGMVDTINTTQLSKLPANRAGRKPMIGCVTCHRGNPGPGFALLP